MAINFKKCLKCGLSNSIKILYGLPSFEAHLKAQAGKIKLGGCCISAGAPEYSCKDCGYEWNREQAVDAAYAQIKGLKASVGGYFGGYYDVFIDFTTGKVTWTHWGEGDEIEFHKTIRPASIKELLDDLKMVNLLEWKSKYIEPGVCDGTQWSVEIIREGKNLKKYGSNKFPDEWEGFCIIVSKITGKKFR